MKKYQPKEIESKWQKRWDEINLYASNLLGMNKYYVLAEFAYPSGDLHMGHWFTWAGADIYARFKRMQGFNVFFPNGFDAFGLPAENAAIKRNIHPQDWTMSNVARMKEQYKTMGPSFTFDYEVITCLPEYYKWNQWLFLKMLDRGWAYKGKYVSNWCKVCQTVLANEGVVDGSCWRCGTSVEQREVDQWFFKITDFAEELLWPSDPAELGVDWPKSVRDAQNAWIGKSSGASIHFEDITVFTTRPDTIFGATFIVLAPEHPLVSKYTTSNQKQVVSEYIKQAAKKSELERKENKDKIGVFTGSTVKNPLTGEDIPVWVADYVLMGYGTGAIMAVPAHDERDFEFARRFDLNIKTVIEPVLGEARDNEELRNSIVAILYDAKKDRYLSINWGENMGGNLFVGGGIEGEEDVAQAAAREIKEETGFQNIKLVKTTEKIHYHYIAHSKGVNRKITAIGLLFELESDEQTGITLEENEKGKFTTEWLNSQQVENKVKDDLHKYVFDKLVKGHVYTSEGLLIDSGDFTGMGSAQAREEITKYLGEKGLGREEIHFHLHDWSISRQRYWGTPIPVIHCPKCGVVPVPEKDLPVELPYDVDYAPQGKPPLASNEQWMSVKCPKCGGEAKRDPETMDTFVDSAWYFFRYISPQYDKLPFDTDIAKKIMPVNIYFGGSEHTLGHTLYARFVTKVFKALGLTDLDEFALKRVNHGIVLGPDGQKMSKSKGNVVNPDEEVKKFGTDAVRLYVSFFMPYEGTGPWVSDRIWGTYRFLERVWNLFDAVIDIEPTRADMVVMNNTIKKVGEDIDAIKFNTAVAALMEWLNYLAKKQKVSKEEYRTLLLLLAPFAPYVTEELWEKSSQVVGESVHQQSWPEIDSKFLQGDKITVVVQINGRVRDEVVMDRSAASSEEEAVKIVLKSEKVKKYLNGVQIKKKFFVPGKIINLVV